jgi:hypothetical protein
MTAIAYMKRLAFPPAANAMACLTIPPARFALHRAHSDAFALVFAAPMSAERRNIPIRP